MYEAVRIPARGTQPRNARKFQSSRQSGWMRLESIGARYTLEITSQRYRFTRPSLRCYLRGETSDHRNREFSITSVVPRQSSAHSYGKNRAPMNNIGDVRGIHGLSNVFSRSHPPEKRTAGSVCRWIRDPDSSQRISTSSHESVLADFFKSNNPMKSIPRPNLILSYRLPRRLAGRVTVAEIIAR